MPLLVMAAGHGGLRAGPSVFVEPLYHGQVPRLSLLHRAKSLRRAPVVVHAKSNGHRIGNMPSTRSSKSPSSSFGVSENAKYPFMSARPASRTPNDQRLVDHVQLAD
ncbi:hypothetical protein TRIUR3_32851 [Triticum urartu]|uniref:Uncharacterized protein n=1 Tax=Triticum urartu TaxID=4572 RepID=M7YKF3_TRIUA|nr:hypothetical protein TRIUR3_32851 [Triticum urartu]